MAILLVYRMTALTINMTMPETAWRMGKKNKYHAPVDTSIKTTSNVVGIKIAPIPVPTIVASIVFRGLLIAATRLSCTPAGIVAAQFLHKKYVAAHALQNGRKHAWHLWRNAIRLG